MNGICFAACKSIVPADTWMKAWFREKFPELCRALSAKIAEQKRAHVAAIEPALQQALQENPPPSLQQMTKRLGFSSVSVLKAHAPGLCEKLKTNRRA
jgi:hypothetical protein